MELLCQCNGGACHEHRGDGDHRGRCAALASSGAECARRSYLGSQVLAMDSVFRKGWGLSHGR